MSSGDPTPNSASNTVTVALDRACAGERSAADALLPLVYDELRRLASHLLSGRGKQTLQATAVVHEVYLKLVGGVTSHWESRAHFFAVAARAMRQTIADRARVRSAAKRGGDRKRITLDNLQTPAGTQEIDLDALHEALAKLEQLDGQQARVVECRFLAGMSIEETAYVLGMSPRSVERDWVAAKLWLRRELA